MTKIQLEQTALDLLSIQYTLKYCSYNAIFFCQLPNGISFNISVENNEKIQIWRHIFTDFSQKNLHGTLEMVNKIYMNDNNSNIHFELTSDGDIKCISRKYIKGTDSEAAYKIFCQIIEFACIICKLNTFTF